jgi:hypothetical protein
MNGLVVAIRSELIGLVGEYLEAERAAAYWIDRCAVWTAAHGLAVWREGHPADREKLRQRRFWRRRTAALKERLSLSAL